MTVTAVFSLIAVVEIGSWDSDSVVWVVSVSAEHPDVIAEDSTKVPASIEKVQCFIIFFIDLWYNNINVTSLINISGRGGEIDDTVQVLPYQNGVDSNVAIKKHCN